MPRQLVAASGMMRFVRLKNSPMDTKNTNMHKFDVIILAAGKGTRMGGELPKVLTKVKGIPMLRYTLDAVAEAGLPHSPVVVVGYKADLVKEYVAESNKTGGHNHFMQAPRFAHQAEQKGTGHAVMVARDEVHPHASDILILYGDQPLVRAQTLQSIFSHHNAQTKSPMTMATVRVDSFDGWKSTFADFGRVIRDGSIQADGKGNIIAIVEKKDATDEQKNIKEVNPAYFCVDAQWLWKSLAEITPKNSQGEYYLTDLVAIACRQGHTIASIEIPAEEAFGVNTPEQLAHVEKLLR